MNIHDIKRLTPRRKELRKNQTKAEEKLWQYLRANQLGFKFRRQHSIGGYIADFYCPDKKLIIELDGEIHDLSENIEYDKIRNSFFEELGYIVLRFKNEKVLESSKLSKVLLNIKSYF